MFLSKIFTRYSLIKYITKIEINKESIKLNIFHNISFISKKLYLYVEYQIDKIKGIKKTICSLSKLLMLNKGNNHKNIIHKEINIKNHIQITFNLFFFMLEEIVFNFR
jgi:hypothetical protein